MAQKTIVELVDDLDGGVAAESVAFGLDGVEYNIDLSSANAKRLRDSLSVYVDSARRVGGRQPAAPATRHRTRRSGNGRAARARRSPIAAASRPTWSPVSRPRTAAEIPVSWEKRMRRAVVGGPPQPCAGTVM
jgi:hypothetical protein